MLYTRIDERWVQSIHSGLSSGEGLIWQVHDPIFKREKKGSAYEEVCVDEGVPDKRLLVQQSEFAGALSVMKRAGNTLSPTIRDAWDRGTLNSMVKSMPSRATNAHISIVANVTREELLRGMTSEEMDNGFANRFLWVCSKRSKMLPEGGKIYTVDFDPLCKKITNSIDLVHGRVERDSEASEIWGTNDRPSAGVYAQLTRDRQGMFGTCTARAPAQVLRLSLIYAGLDGSQVIRRIHLQAALEVWRYCEDSARYIFGEALGNAVADEILQALRVSSGGLTRSEIVGLFHRHKSKAELDQAFRYLLEGGMARMETIATGGRPTERWFSDERG